MNRNHPFKPLARQAFSLVEVVLAVGIMSFAIVAIVALLSPSSKNVALAAETQVAHRLADMVNTELQRVGFKELRELICGNNNNQDNKIYLVATRDGERVLLSGAKPDDKDIPNLSDYRAAENPFNDPSIPGIPQRDRFFILEISRLIPVNTGNALFANHPLRYRDGEPSLALSVAVYWPYITPESLERSPSSVNPNTRDDWKAEGFTGQLTPSDKRQSYIFNTVIRP